MTCLLFFSIILLQNPSQAKDTTGNTIVSISVSNEPLKNVLDLIDQQTGFKFFYLGNEVDINHKVTLTFANTPLDAALKKVFQNTELTYTISGRTIVIKSKSNPISPKSASVRSSFSSISGSVRNTEGDYLPGVNVFVKGTNTGTTTDADGKFSIDVPEEGSIIVFSFVGYKVQEVGIGNQTNLAIKLDADITTLSEVIVVGYGTQEKRDVTSSVGIVKASEIQKSVVSSFESALQGRASGLQITQASGVPGGLVTVRVRGTTSINGASEPLYIVDGIPINSGGRGDGGGGVSGSVGASNNPLSDINPNDIESISILKDASAAAIYGARAGSGVILITTKKGQAGKTKFNVGYSQGVTVETNRINSLDGKQYLQLLDEAWANSGNAGPAPVPNRPGFSRAVAESTSSNHLNTVLRKGTRQEAYLSASGGSESTNFYMGSTYYKEKGIIVGNDFDRLSGRFSIDNQSHKNIKVGSSIGVTYATDYRMGTGESITAGGFGIAQTQLPIYPYYNSNGTYFDPYNGTSKLNPGAIGRNVVMFQDRNNYYNYQTKLRVLGGMYSDITILKGLSLRSEVGIDLYNQSINSYYSKYVRRINGTPSIPAKPDKGVIGEPGALARSERVLLNNWNTNNTITYKHKIADHSFKILAGMSFNKNNSPYLAVQGESFPNDYFRDPSQATYKNIPSGSTSDRYAFLAYFSRLNYSFLDRYLMELSFRREGSSRFGDGNKFGNFPAASVGWIVSDEFFFESINFVSFLKLRASYGQTGNAAGIQNFQANNQWKNALSFNIGAYKGGSYFFPEQVGNPDLHWEKQNQLDIGLEYQLIDGRISGTFDFYNKISYDMLLEFPGGATQGQETLNIVLNAGSLRNRGVEFNISSVNLVDRLKWSTDFNISRNTNTVLDVAGIQPSSISGSTSVGTFVGKPLATFNMIRWAGVDPETGDELVYDADGQIRLARTMTSEELLNARVGIFDKPALPKFTGGLNNTLRYKGVDLSVLFTFSYGNWVYDEGEKELSYFSESGTNLRTTALNRWSETNRYTDFPKLYYTDPVNDPLRNMNTTRFLHNASYLRLKTLQLGYMLPQALLQRAGVSSCRFYITTQNLHTFSDYPGWDPENVNDLGGTDNAGVQARNLSQGFTNKDLPQIKTYLIGVSIGL